MGFIYKVTNNINKKVYIGQCTISIQERFKQHLADSKNPSKCHRPFYDAINKYGRENFSIELIEEISNLLLNDREKFWIKYYNSYIGFENCNGYNATLGGDATITKDYEAIVNDYKITKNKTQTAKNLNCCVETVTRALNSYHLSTINKNRGKKIQRIDSDGNTKEYNSVKQASLEIAEKLNKNIQTVRKRINYVTLHNLNQKAYGYYWKEL